jgi:transposase
MATAYSDDLRRKLLEAHQRKEGSLAQLAGRFSVSVAWALKVSASFTRTGRMERPRGCRRGPRSKITPAIEADLKNWIEKQSDLTLAELQLRLYEQRHMEVSIGRLWAVLKELGLRLKKSRSTPASKIAKRGVFGGRTGARPVRGSTRRT